MVEIDRKRLTLSNLSSPTYPRPQAPSTDSRHTADPTVGTCLRLHPVSYKSNLGTLTYSEAGGAMGRDVINPKPKVLEKILNRKLEGIAAWLKIYPEYISNYNVSEPKGKIELIGKIMKDIPQILNQWVHLDSI